MSKKKKHIIRKVQKENIFSILLGNGNIYSCNDSKYNDNGNINKVYKLCFNEISKDMYELKKNILKLPWLEKHKSKFMFENNIYKAEYLDTKKLRIFHKWLYRGHIDNKLKTTKQILQYLYTPLSIYILYKDTGIRYKDKVIIKLNNYTSIQDAYRYIGWLYEKFNVKAQANIDIKFNYFDYINIDKFNEAKRRIEEGKYGVDIAAKKHNINKDSLQEYIDNKDMITMFNKEIKETKKHSYEILFSRESWEKIISLFKTIDIE